MLTDPPTKYPRRKHRAKPRASVLPPPPPPGPPAVITSVYAGENLDRLNVVFDRAVTVVDADDVGAWMVHDVSTGTFAPLVIGQVDAQTIVLVTPEGVDNGTVGYSGGNPGGVTSAGGFLDSDSGSYQ